MNITDHPSEGQIAFALIQQVTKAAGEGHESGVVTIITRPLFTIYRLMCPQITNQMHIDHLQRPTVYGSETLVIENDPRLWSYSFKRP